MIHYNLDLKKEIIIRPINYYPEPESPSAYFDNYQDIDNKILEIEYKDKKLYVSYLKKMGKDKLSVPVSSVFYINGNFTELKEFYISNVTSDAEKRRGGGLTFFERKLFLAIGSSGDEKISLDSEV